MANIMSRSAILAKIETTYGVSSNPTPAADAKLVARAISYSSDFESLERNYVKTTMGTTAPLNVMYGSNLTFDAEIKGEGSSLGVAPEIGTFFRSANWKETINMGVSVVYTPSSFFGQEEGQESASMVFHKDKWTHYVNGFRNNFTITGSAGQFCGINVNGQGLWESAAPGNVPAQTVKTHKPPRLVNAQCNLDNYAAVIKSFTINSNNTINRRMSACAQNGVLEYVITERAPTAQFIIELPEHCDWDVWSLLENTTEMVVSFRIGQTSKNRMGISMPAANLTNLDANSDENGIVTATLDFQLNPSSGDDELIFTFD